jgi:uncharacterized protein (DUF2062 family)
MTPVIYFSYKLGAWILRMPAHEIHFEPTLDWLTTQLASVWQPFLLGCLLMSVGFALLGNLAIRGLWRVHVAWQWRARERRRQLPPRG